MTDAPQTTMSEAEKFARKCEPWAWALDPPDISSAHARGNSLIRARVHLGELWWNPVSEQYEETGKP